MNKKKGCLYSLFGLSLFVLICWIAWQIFVWYHFPPKGKKYIPVVNPHTKYFLMIKGFVDPSLKNKLRITFDANYYTTNKACMASFSAGDWVDGVEFERDIKFIYLVTPSTKGFYRIKIPLDKYKRGFCQWALNGVNYTYTYKNETQKPYSDTALPFSNNGDAVKNILQTWFCNNHFCTLKHKDFMPLILLNKKHNQKLTLNFIRKKNNETN